jgi:hypothetical protein
VRFEIERDFLFFSFVCEDGSDEEDETVGGHSVVQLQTLLGRGDGSEHGQTIDTRLDVGRRAVFLRQHRGRPGDLVLQQTKEMGR